MDVAAKERLSHSKHFAWYTVRIGCETDTRTAIKNGFEWGGRGTTVTTWHLRE
jgi:hypothetical protein